MASPFPIKDMTTAEKLHAMELLWDDLCRNADAITSPDWHQTTLQAREEALTQGRDTIEDWETAKQQIRNGEP